MNNPEQLYHTIDTATMYKYDHHTNIPWNFTSYQTPKLEVNPDLEMQKRKWESQKKGIKDNKYVTKRGFYMDYEMKVAKGIPSTHAHGQQREWSFEKLKKNGERNKVDPKLSKYTYLDRIQMQQKARKSPGTGAYSLQKSLKQKDLQIEKLKKKKQSDGEKVYFYMNTEKLSEGIPGSGNYCPHLPSPKIRPTKTDHKFWVQKHKQQSQKIKKRDSVKPAPGTHSPMNTTFTTFDQLKQELAKPCKKQLLGTDARFEYTRQQKKKIVEQRPAPSNYQTTIEWKGKDVSPKKTTWNDLVWRGHSMSVYH